MAYKKPKVIIFSGYGLNCELETQYAFNYVGCEADTIHVNDIINKPSLLRQYQILVMPGGFSYGDDTGSGKAYANKIKNHIFEEIERFVSGDKLALGICNGFQILTGAGLLPGALLHNDNARYIDRWVDVKVVGKSPWLTGLDTLSLPIAHGEGKYYVGKETLKGLHSADAIGLVYIQGEMSDFQNLEYNPNGSLEDIAGVTAYEGRILGMMPHPERSLFFNQLPNWTNVKEEYKRSNKKIPKEGPGIALFRNALSYFK